MKKLNVLLVFTALTIIFSGCSKDEEDKEKTVEMTIYQETIFSQGFMSDIWVECFVFSDSDNDEKRIFSGYITEDFDDIFLKLEKGYEYGFTVRKIWMNNPPADGSNIKYVNLGFHTKEKVITENRERVMEMTVAPETVQFIPYTPREMVDIIGEDGELYSDYKQSKVYDALFVKYDEYVNGRPLLEIEDFDYEEGYEYRLKVREVIQAEPYAERYVLVDVLSKEEK